MIKILKENRVKCHLTSVEVPELLTSAIEKEKEITVMYNGKKYSIYL